MALSLPADKKHSGDINYAAVVPFSILTLAVGAVGFFLIYTSVKTGKGLAFYDQIVLEWVIDHRSHELTTIMQIVTNVLSPVAILIAGGIFALVWGVLKKELWRPFVLALAMAATYFLSIGLKDFIHRARPSAESMIAPLETDFAFPSGHTIGVAAAVFVIAYLVCSRAHKLSFIFIWIFVALVSIGLIAFSRMYLGYHWLTDVSASVALAFIVLAVTIFIDCTATKIKN